MSAERLPPDEFELKVYETVLDEDNPRRRLAGLISAARHLKERIEAAQTTGILYVAERQLLLRDKEVSLNPRQIQFILSLANREDLVTVEELSERMGINNVDVVRTAGRVKGILKRSGFGEAYLLSEKDGYFLAPLIEVELGRNIRPDTEVKTFTCGEAAQLSFLEPGFVKQLCQNGELMLPEAHFVSNNDRLIILPQGVQRLRAISELKGKGIRHKSSRMKYEVEEKDPIRETPFQRAKRELIETLSQATSSREEEKIGLLIRLTKENAPGRRQSLKLEKLASFAYDKGIERPTQREIARIRILMPYLESQINRSYGSLTFDSEERTLTLSFA